MSAPSPLQISTPLIPYRSGFCSYTTFFERAKKCNNKISTVHLYTFASLLGFPNPRGKKRNVGSGYSVCNIGKRREIEKTVILEDQVQKTNCNCLIIPENE